MTTVSENNSPHLTLVEQASTPSTPAAGTQKLFIDDADHLLKLVDESDVVTEVGGGGGGGGVVVQRVITETGASSTGTTLIPLDDTIPQNTEGNEYMTRTITPTDAANILYIEVIVFAVHSVAAWISAALFKDSDANALAAMTGFSTTAGGGTPIVFRHKMTAGGTSEITFKVRAGGHTAGTTTFNGNAGTRVFGGVMASSITVTEFTP
ncbi:MAG TPA: virulence factor Pgp3 [Anaerolineales bacterium]|nr:virulence factor Pgp3 [Anaerolineales bacterium]